MKTTLIPRDESTRCPSCGEKLDTTLSQNKAPSPFDVTICVYCGGLLEFTNNLGLAPLSKRVRAQLTSKQVARIHRLQAAIRGN